jgi:hypothetical protein
MKDPFIQRLGELVKECGPVAVEWIVCNHCHVPSIMVHPFCESVSCPDCGKRNPSLLPIYNEPKFDE